MNFNIKINIKKVTKKYECFRNKDIRSMKPKKLDEREINKRRTTNCVKTKNILK